MKVNEAYPGRFLKAEDLGDGDVNATINAVKIEQIGVAPNVQEKPVLFFDGQEKGLVLNKTNASAIAKIHGDEMDNWIGKRISLYATEVEYQGETNLGIRVRLRAPSMPKATATAA